MITRNLLRKEWQNGIQRMFCDSTELDIALQVKEGVPNGSKLTVINETGCTQYIFSQGLNKWVFYKVVNSVGTREGLKVKEISVASNQFTLIDGIYKADLTHGCVGNVQLVQGFIGGQLQIIDWTNKSATVITIGASTNDAMVVKIFYI